MSHTIPIRIYYEDTDAGGITYHASFVRFGERGRTEFLRHLGHNNRAMANDLGVLFVVRHMEVDYFKPAYLDDLIELTTSIVELKKSSFIMRHSFVKDQKTICEIQVTLVCVDTSGIKPVRLPDNLRKEFEPHLYTGV